MHVTIVTIAWDSKHEDILRCPEARCMDIDLNRSSVSLQWQKPEGLWSVRRQ